MRKVNVANGIINLLLGFVSFVSGIVLFNNYTAGVSVHSTVADVLSNMGMLGIALGTALELYAVIFVTLGVKNLIYSIERAGRGREVCSALLEIVMILTLMGGIAYLAFTSSVDIMGLEFGIAGLAVFSFILLISGVIVSLIQLFTAGEKKCKCSQPNRAEPIKVEPSIDYTKPQIRFRNSGR